MYMQYNISYAYHQLLYHTKLLLFKMVFIVPVRGTLDNRLEMYKKLGFLVGF